MAKKLDRNKILNSVKILDPDDAQDRPRSRYKPLPNYYL